MTPTSFNISIPDSQLQALHQKLSQAHFPDELDDASWDMGVPLSEMQRLVTVWREKFDWRAEEQRLNAQLNQFRVPVSVAGFGELDVHFVHHRSENPYAVPLLFIHGWPGSFLEATKLLPLLTNDDGSGPAFDVVVPSLPNFGFSQGVKQKGFGLAQYAEAMHGVMTALGYEEYTIQGGDWGSMIARAMAQLYAPHIQAIHLNFVPVAPPYPWRNPLLFMRSLLTIPFSAKDRGFLARTMQYTTKGNAYMRQQETRPQTLGYGLHDSPVALLAWIYDKMHSWSDGYPWTDEEILTWVSVYYFSTAGPAASTRIYYEASAPKLEVGVESGSDGKKKQDGPSIRNYISLADILAACAPRQVRFAVTRFKEELILLPWAWSRQIGNVVRETEYGRGGHFAAWEVPQLLAADLKAFLGREGQAYGAVTGRDGYAGEAESF